MRKGRTALSILLAFVFLYAVPSAFAEASGITVAEVKNTVEHRKPDEEAVPLTLESILKAGEAVATGSSSYAVLKLDASNILRIDSETVMVIDEIDYKPGASRNMLNLVSGAVLSEVNSAIGQGRFRVQAPNLAVGVRGTVFWLEVGAATEEKLDGAVVAGAAVAAATKGSKNEGTGKVVGGLIAGLFGKKKNVRSADDNVIMLQGECNVQIKATGKVHVVKSGQKLTLPAGQTEPRVEPIDEKTLPSPVKKYLKENPEVKTQLAEDIKKAVEAGVTIAAGAPITRADLQIGDIHYDKSTLSEINAKYGNPVTKKEYVARHANSDRTFIHYTYSNGFAVDVEKSRGGIYDITITSPALATPRGIKVGMTVEQMVAAYGKAHGNQYPSGNIFYSYGHGPALGSTNIDFEVSNNKIVSISMNGWGL